MTEQRLRTRLAEPEQRSQAAVHLIHLHERPTRPGAKHQPRDLLFGLLMAASVELAMLSVLLLVRSIAPDQHPPATTVTFVPLLAPSPPRPSSSPAMAAVPLRALPPPVSPPIAIANAPPLPDLPLATAAEVPLPLHLPRHSRPRTPASPAPPSPPFRLVTTAAASDGVVAAAATHTRGSPAPAATPDHATIDSFEGRLRAAVQAALRYPAAARMMGATGQAHVGFRWCDGVPSALQVVSSAGMAALDDAALAAVRNAAYPRPPEDLAHRTLDLVVKVDFRVEDSGG